MDLVLVALAVADIIVFAQEFKEHRWSLKAKLEAVALGLLLALGLGDWHLHSLATKHDLAQAKQIEEANKLASDARANAESLRKDVEPFLVMAKASYPQLDPRLALGRLANEIEGLRQRTNQLETNTAMRDLGSRAAEISAELKRAPKGFASITYPSNDPEAEQFAMQLSQALESANWKTSLTGLTNAPESYGLGLFMRDTKSPPAFAAALAQALGNAKVAFGTRDDNSLEDAKMTIAVGHRMSMRPR
jgi:uncharacterized phage infection (PIP) family protein YhgE